MKIRLEHNGTVFEFERKPMPEHRFKALCLLVLAAATFIFILAANDF